MAKKADTPVDEPVAFIASAPAVGQFVGVGCSHVSVGGDAWLVDEETGCIVAAG